MDKRVREILFEPMSRNILSAIIPDFVFRSGEKAISAPAQLARHGDDFRFTVHFAQASRHRNFNLREVVSSPTRIRRQFVGRSMEKSIFVVMTFFLHRR